MALPVFLLRDNLTRVSLPNWEKKPVRHEVKEQRVGRLSPLPACCYQTMQPVAEPFAEPCECPFYPRVPRNVEHPPRSSRSKNPCGRFLCTGQEALGEGMRNAQTCAPWANTSVPHIKQFVLCMGSFKHLQGFAVWQYGVGSSSNRARIPLQVVVVHAARVPQQTTLKALLSPDVHHPA